MHKPERKGAGGLAVLHEVVRSAVSEEIDGALWTIRDICGISFPEEGSFISVMSLVSHWETVKWISGFFLSFLLVDGKAPPPPRLFFPFCWI